MVVRQKLVNASNVGEPLPFLAAGFIFVNNNAPAEIQGSAQALFIMLTYGFGMYFGTEGAGLLNQRLTREAPNPSTGQIEHVTDWRAFFVSVAAGTPNVP